MQWRYDDRSGKWPWTEDGFRKRWGDRSNAEPGEHSHGWIGSRKNLGKIEERIRCCDRAESPTTRCNGQKYTERPEFLCREKMRSDSHREKTGRKWRSRGLPTSSVRCECRRQIQDNPEGRYERWRERRLFQGLPSARERGSLRLDFSLNSEAERAVRRDNVQRREPLN